MGVAVGIERRQSLEKLKTPETLADAGGDAGRRRRCRGIRDAGRHRKTLEDAGVVGPDDAGRHREAPRDTGIKTPGETGRRRGDTGRRQETPGDAGRSRKDAGRRREASRETPREHQGNPKGTRRHL